MNTGDAAGDSYTSIENLRGSAHDDTLTGNSIANGLKGGAGADVLNGGAGDDVLNGGVSADALDGGAGIDTASYADATSGVSLNLAAGGTGGEAAGDTFASIENAIGSIWGDVIVGTGGANTIDGGVSNDVLFGGFGADTLIGGAGQDRLLGGVGADVLDGGVGSDVASYAGAANAIAVDIATGGGGTAGEATGDTFVSIDGVIGSNFNDQIYGFAGVNVLFGGAGNDLIDARSGNDIVRGDAGDDTIIGGSGNDRLSGGVGSDTFVFSAGHGRDRIDDWQDGTDTLDFSGHTGVTGYADLTVRSVGTSAVVEDGTGGVLVVAGAAGTIDASDFLF